MTSQPARARLDFDALDDRELLARVQAQDREAYEALFRRFHARVYRFARGRLHDAPLAEETAADVFFEVWKSAAAFRGDSKPSTWIFGIAHFKCLAADRHRSRAKRASLIPMSPEVMARAEDGRSTEAQLQARDEMRGLERIVHSLGAEQRSAAELVWLEGLSQQEAARRLGVSIDTIKMRVWRARQQVRKQWKRQDGETQ